MGAVRPGFDLCFCVCVFCTSYAGRWGVGIDYPFLFFFLFLYICIRDIGGMNLMSIVLNYILLLFIHCVLHDQGQYRD